MAKFISLYVKKQLRLDRLTFNQKQMALIGEFALRSFKQRLYSATGTNDQPARPLSKGYAIWKSKMMSGNSQTREAAANYATEKLSKMPIGRKLLTRKNPRRWQVRKMRTMLTMSANRLHSNKRDYCVTGEFLDNLSLRQVSDNMARARWTKDELRNRAIALSQKDDFFGFSPNDRRLTLEFARPIFRESVKRIAVQKQLSAPR